MAAVWTAASVTMYTLVFLNKYLSGTIYLNYYIDGVTGILAYLLGEFLYRWLKIRYSIIISTSITIFGVLGILLFN